MGGAWVNGLGKVTVGAAISTLGLLPVAAVFTEPNAGAAAPKPDHITARLTPPIPHLNAPIVGIAPTVDDKGYWLAAADGGVFTFGDAPFDGSLGGEDLGAPVVGIATSGIPYGNNESKGSIDGYWLVDAAGGVFTFGGAQFFGSLGGTHLNAPIVGIVPQWSSGFTRASGYFLVASDGGVFTFGNFTFPGSLAGHLSSPLTAVMPGEIAGGFYAVLADGEVITYTDRGLNGFSPYGGRYDIPPPAPSVVEPAVHDLASRVVAITPGFTLADATGGVLNDRGYGFFGSASTYPLAAPIVAMRETSPDTGYWLVAADGSVYCFGNAPFYGSTT